MDNPTQEQRSELGRALNALRKTRAGGRPKVLRHCPKCGVPYGAVDLQRHIPRCGGKYAEG